MDLGLQGKTAIITAASKGIGRACALALAREGAKIAICARGKAQLEESADEIRRLTGAEVFAQPMDLAIASDIEAFIEAVAKHYGAINILVAIAGQPPRGGIDDISDAEMVHSFEITVLAMLRLVRGVRKYMKQAGSGRIVTIQSRSTKEPVPDHIASNATRPAVAGLFKDLSRVLPADGIGINTLLPGRIDTDRFREGAERSPLGVDEYYRRMSADIPLGRYGKPSDLADAVAFLVSERAGYINGAVLQVDGGLMRTIW